ncbi:hypothetical protein ACFFX1_34055 [Dactylosporangium sucinum]|uniref:hypothetical protein n=1 Tax=Dactylosporangium sucinum TaxID=1424081 RepID=UPI0035ECD3AB
MVRDLPVLRRVFGDAVLYDTDLALAGRRAAGRGEHPGGAPPGPPPHLVAAAAQHEAFYLAT